MKQAIKKFLNDSKGQFHRYNSWKHCYKAFGEIKDIDLLSLHLAFYLASWGMYRGSSQLLQKDYLIHNGTVKILIDYSSLRCDFNKEVSSNSIGQIISLVEDLKHYYKKYKVTPTDTLISKILLGTLGCIPAFDRYFIDGAKQSKYKMRSLKEKSFLELFRFIEDNDIVLNEIQKLQKDFYPKMKLTDMYFWQLGYNLNKK